MLACQCIPFCNRQYCDLELFNSRTKEGPRSWPACGVAGWLAACLRACLPAWLADWLVCWFCALTNLYLPVFDKVVISSSLILRPRNGHKARLLACCLAGWLAGRVAGWIAGWLAGWLAGWVASSKVIILIPAVVFKQSPSGHKLSFGGARQRVKLNDFE